MSAFTVTLIIRNVIGKLNLQGEETPPEPNLFGWRLTKAKNALKRPIYWNYLSFLGLWVKLQAASPLKAFVYKG
ncbi:hypothetical protein CS548_08625 [Porphyromonas gingivalis]|nr:hypothetical protein CS548_08625 [Porphyromonas gingivalis]